MMGKGDGYPSGFIGALKKQEGVAGKSEGMGIKVLRQNSGIGKIAPDGAEWGADAKKNAAPVRMISLEGQIKFDSYFF